MDKTAGILRTLLAALIVVLLFAVGALLFRIEKRLAAQASVTYANNESIERGCVANNTEYTCTFTNKLSFPTTTCLKGTLTSKSNKNAVIESLTVCSGRLNPAETRTVSAPWAGRFATEICFAENQFGKRLDWEKCEFETAPVDLSAAVSPLPE
jgi:hypothetical protein